MRRPGPRRGVTASLCLLALACAPADVPEGADDEDLETSTAAIVADAGQAADALPMAPDAPPMAPEETEIWEPVPAVVDPGGPGSAPSDAIVLFDGTGLSAWESADDGSEAGWVVEEGVMTVEPGAGTIRTRRGFGDVQLHIEWRAPAEVSGEGQDRGNSGVFLMRRYEVQVLDSYENRTYSNGQAGSLYKQHIPLVNASRRPGEWQSYDILFTAPRFDDGGGLLSPAYVTVLHNGVLIQNHVELEGPTVFTGLPEYEVHPDREPILLQDHGSRVSYRNIWLRELSPTP